MILCRNSANSAVSSTRGPVRDSTAEVDFRRECRRDSALHCASPFIIGGGRRICRSEFPLLRRMCVAMANAEIDSGIDSAQARLPEPLLAMVSEISWSAKPDGSLTWIHPAAKNLYGRTADELLSNPKLRLEAIHPGDRDRVLEHLAKSAEQTHLQLRLSCHRRRKEVHRVHETVYYQSGAGERTLHLRSDSDHHRTAQPRNGARATPRRSIILWSRVCR